MKEIMRNTFPAETWRRNDVALTTMRRDYVASTSVCRHFDAMCPVGCKVEVCVVLYLNSTDDFTTIHFPSSPAFDCPICAGKVHPCPLLKIVFPSLLLSTSSSLFFYCALYKPDNLITKSPQFPYLCWQSPSLSTP